MLCHFFWQSADFISDIHECVQNHNCSENASCTNTEGSYNCSCNPGFSGDGLGCGGMILNTINNFETHVQLQTLLKTRVCYLDEMNDLRLIHLTHLLIGFKRTWTADKKFLTAVIILQLLESRTHTYLLLLFNHNTGYQIFHFRHRRVCQKYPQL